MSRPGIIWLTIAFLAGCVTTALVNVPRAHADAATAARWEHWCIDVDGTPKNGDLEKAGAEGFELVSVSFRPPVVQSGNSVGGGATLLCFKRPR
ncbi:MAG: hypothetical protein INH41_01345 [Myxococcaceae bacterium]|jgi:hypothetical protein|nr:hypothetical protein [Myxococcaceae bacterium]MCA3011023.1 hypothetical protein [Myxococcaceae bacterium]